MIFFLPTYKRSQLLPIIIDSILTADMGSINERIVILIHNNFYADAEKIEKILTSISTAPPFEIRVIHRREEVLASKWFEAILEMAQEDEVIILLGDDDLLAPWGVRNRFTEINRLSAEIILTEAVSRIYFFDKGDYCYPDFKICKSFHQEEYAYDWAFDPSKHGQTTAIFNHCWRNTVCFRAAIDRAISWCDLQKDWGGVYSIGLVFSWLPFAVQVEGGRVLNLQERSVIRGAVYEEAIRQDYADGGTISFYSLLMYNMFSKHDVLPPNDAYVIAKEIYKKSFIRGAIANLTNKNITLQMFRDGMRDSGLNWPLLLSYRAFSWREILRLFTFFRGWKLRSINKSRKGLVATKSVIAQLKEMA